MKILVFSDIYEWIGYEELVDKVQPDVVVLAGDLTCDGGVSFLRIPRQLETRRKKHVDRFYHFLRHAGHRSKVIVIKGNHDEEFEGDYVPERINRISGCDEISGKTIEIEGLLFLGLGFNDTYYLRILKPIISKFTGKVDVVVMHGFRIRLVSSMKPRIIIRGGFSFGKYLVHNIPSVFNNVGIYTIVELEKGKISGTLQYRLGSSEKVKTQPSVLSKRYEWLKPYSQI